MQQIPQFLQYALTFAGQYKYPLIFIGSIFEGPFIMIACGFLLNFQVFDIVPLFLSLALGDLTGDVVWYFAGQYFLLPFLKKHGRFLSVTPELLEKAKGLFARYHVKILLISKITIGFGMSLATIMAAGATKVRFRSFFLLNAAGEFFLVTFLLLIGYVFGTLYATIADAFKIIFLIGAILFSLLIVFGFSKYVKNRIMKE